MLFHSPLNYNREFKELFCLQTLFSLSTATYISLKIKCNSIVQQRVKVISDVYRYDCVMANIVAHTHTFAFQYNFLFKCRDDL